MPAQQRNDDLKIWRNLRYDLPAGLVVFLVAVPLCLGIALASGAPLSSGIIAGIIGGLIVPLISRSPLGVSGPAAGLAVIVFEAVGQIGFEAFLTAVVLGGMLQIALGFLRAGIIGYYFPSSVITGMLSGIGIIIALKQIPHLVGYDTDWEGDTAFVEPGGETTLSALVDMLGAFHLGATLIGAICLAILIAWEMPFFKRQKLFQWLPGPLMAVIAGAVVNWAFNQYAPELAVRSEHLVSLPVLDDLSQLPQFFTFPDLTSVTDPHIFTLGVIVAVVASLETLLSVEAVDKLDPHKRVTPTNLELIAQGAGNMASGLIGGLPITQVIVRSSANIQAGGRTKMATMVHGTFLLVSAFFFPFLLNMIPLASLAAILLLVGYKLAKPQLFTRMYRDGWYQFIPFMVTIAGLVFTDLLIGVGIGMATAIFFLLLENFKIDYYRHEEEADHRVQITLAEQVTFLNKANLLKELNRIPPYKKVIIDGSNARYIDHDVLEILDNFKSEAKFKNIHLTLIGLPIEGSLPPHTPPVTGVASNVPKAAIR
ncbi:MAG: SulP family inorganic anion transporter [Methylohalobius crimeensis]